MPELEPHVVREVQVAFALIVTFALGVAAGVDWTRYECTKAKCAVPCGLTHVKVIRDADDWRDWSCRCSEVHP